MDYYCDVLCTLFLTASDVMMEFLQICSNEEINESTSWWPEVEYIFSKCSFWDELFL